MRTDHLTGDSGGARWLGWLALLIGMFGLVVAALAFPFAYANGLRGAELLDVSALIGLSYAPVGAFIAWRQPRNAVGWLLLVVGFTQGLSAFTTAYSRYAFVTSPGRGLPAADLASVLAHVTWLPGFITLTNFVPLLFPNGKLLSPRWRPLLWVGGALLLLLPYATALFWPYRGAALIDNDQAAIAGTLLDKLPLSPILLTCGLGSVISLFVRFRRAGAVERQQIKWFAYAVALTFTVIVLISVLEGIDQPAVRQIVYLLSLPVAFTLPAACAFAILRYRLWDIDLVVRRTLVYGALSALLALIFFGTVVVLQRLFTGATGEQSPVALVASTLAIAALFSPLRRRVQGVVDRRFYRRKYDAQRVLAEFAAVARDETDVNRLTARLASVVDAAMQPERVGVWVREEERA